MNKHQILRKLTALLVTFAVSFLGFIGNVQPVHAAQSMNSLATPLVLEASNNPISEIGASVERCLLKTPENGLEEIACNVAKEVATAGMIVGTCYVVTASGASVMTPLGSLALARLCGTASAVKPGKWINRSKKLVLNSVH